MRCIGQGSRTYPPYFGHAGSICGVAKAPFPSAGAWWAVSQRRQRMRQCIATIAAAAAKQPATPQRLGMGPRRCYRSIRHAQNRGGRCVTPYPIPLNHIPPCFGKIRFYAKKASPLDARPSDSMIARHLATASLLEVDIIARCLATASTLDL